MNTAISSRIRLGGLLLGISALLFATFPLVRPFFPRPNDFSPAELTVASQTFTMPSWAIAHFMAIVALVLLLFGFLTLHAYLANSRGERRAFVGMIVGLAGTALILPTVGVEAYALPVLGRAYLDGKADLASFVGALYGGPDTIALLLGLLLLAIGAVTLAVAIWSSGTLPKWAGVILAAGLVLWFPLFPQIIRIVDGLLIGIGGLWLAWAIGAKMANVSLDASVAPDAASGVTA
jgi:hypothetical protein